jgi:hypothetical protein
MMSELIVAEAVPEGTASRLLSKALLLPLGIVDDGAEVVGIMLIRLVYGAPSLGGGLDDRHLLSGLILLGGPCRSARLDGQDLRRPALARSSLLGRHPSSAREHRSVMTQSSWVFLMGRMLSSFLIFLLRTYIMNAPLIVASSASGMV